MSEKQNIEWKETCNDRYLQWICGFANAQGGKICIGYDDKGKVIGIKDSKKLLEDLPNKIRDTMGIIVDVNLLTEKEKCISEFMYRHIRFQYLTKENTITEAGARIWF